MAETDVETDRRATHGRPRWQAAAAGVVLALLVVALLDELQRNWRYAAYQEPYSDAYLIWSAVAAAVAAFVGVRHPVAGLWAGGTLACVVVVGLLLGGPEDAFGTTSSGLGDAQGLVRWAAHHMPIVVAAGSALGAACASRLRPR